MTWILRILCCVNIFYFYVFFINCSVWCLFRYCSDSFNSRWINSILAFFLRNIYLFKPVLNKCLHSFVFVDALTTMKKSPQGASHCYILSATRFFLSFSFTWGWLWDVVLLKLVNSGPLSVMITLENLNTSVYLLKTFFIHRRPW